MRKIYGVAALDYHRRTGAQLYGHDYAIGEGAAMAIMESNPGALSCELLPVHGLGIGGGSDCGEDPGPVPLTNKPEAITCEGCLARRAQLKALALALWDERAVLEPILSVPERSAVDVALWAHKLTVMQIARLEAVAQGLPGDVERVFVEVALPRLVDARRLEQMRAAGAHS